MTEAMLTQWIFFSKHKEVGVKRMGEWGSIYSFRLDKDLGQVP